MKKIGRNDPCPCGSGKKYKHCCLGRSNETDRNSINQQVMKEVKERLESLEFESLEEVQEFIDGFMERKNRVPQIDFLGLSSEQVHRMLHHPLETLQDMVRFDHALEPRSFQDIPIVKKSAFYDQYITWSDIT